MKGCDGLWENANLNEMTKLIEESKVSSLSEKLVNRAKECGSEDNISAIFVSLKKAMM